ncbi:hypothetical protein [Kordiimonas sp.]|uniref:hypothetical protein n=1 Tax=Kordiimonas sp. TaxID=1970157 RepID=UPI003A938E7E
MAIVYLAPATEKTIGGVKVIYRHAELLAGQGIDCQVFHPSNPDFSCTWFDHNAPIKREPGFDKKNDFFVVPEAWVATSGRQCMAQKARFAVFVQNGYLFSQGYDPQNYDQLREVYEAADLILSISDDTSSMIKLAFPTLAAEKIVRVQLSVGNIFSDAGVRKKKLISYMPRRLTQHSSLVEFFLKEHMPSEWKLQPVDGLTENGVAGKLAQSSIFLSFSAMEGVGLPPLEAALCGNVVVGYTGEAGKEYFEPPVFKEVLNGDFKSFVKQVLAATDYVDDGSTASAAFHEGVARVRKAYSRERELERLLAFNERVKSIF